MILWRTLRLYRLRLLSVHRFFSSNRKDYYHILGVSRTANTQEIKQAFYTLSKKYHPDVVGSDSKQFIEIREAYEVLKNEEKRRAYDAGFDTSDPFFNQKRPDSDFYRVRKVYEYRSNYTQDEINQMFLKHIREQLRKSAEHEAKMRRQTREKHHDDFVKNPTSEWARFTEDFNQRKPFESSNYRLGRSNFGRIVITYFFVFLLIALLRTAFGPTREEERVIITSTSPGDEYTSPKDRLRKMMETPPMNIDEKSDSVFPYGFPNSDRKE